MADIFLSYKKHDRALAERVVKGLEGAGYSVWWDSDLEVRSSWDAEIEREIAAAAAVVVLWTLQSVQEGTFVRREADYAHAHGKYVPALCAPCEIPLTFRLIQAADLMDWDERPEHRGWCGLIAAIEAVRRGEKPRESAQTGRAATAIFLTEPKLIGQRMPPPRQGERWERAATFQFPGRPSIKGSFEPHIARPSLERVTWAGEVIYVLGRFGDGFTELSSGSAHRIFAFWPETGQSTQVFKNRRESSQGYITNIAALTRQTAALVVADTVRVCVCPASDMDQWRVRRIPEEVVELTHDNKVEIHRPPSIATFPCTGRRDSPFDSGDYFNSNGRSIASSSDGRHIARDIGRLEHMGPFDPKRADHGWRFGIWTLPNRTNASERYEEFNAPIPEGDRYQRSPGSQLSWGPSSNWVLLGHHPYFLFDRQAKQWKALRPEENWSYNLDMIWHPDRDILACAAYRLHPIGDRAAGGHRHEWRIELIDAASLQKLIIKPTPHTKDIQDLSWSADGRYIASASSDGSVGLWDLSTDEFLSMYPNIGEVHRVDFSPDGNRLAIVGQSPEKNGTSIWDHKNQVEIARLKGTSKWFHQSIWRFDGQMIALMRDEHTIDVHKFAN